jgi:hypothetical protein
MVYLDRLMDDKKQLREKEKLLLEKEASHAAAAAGTR